MAEDRRRLRLALSFSVIPREGSVHLVAGEDFRFTLTGPRIELWAPPLLARLDGTVSLSAVLASVAAPDRDAALDLVQELVSERALVEATPEQSPEPVRGEARIHGDGLVADALRASATSGAARSDAERASALIHVLAQDTLDESAAVAFNRRRLDDGAPWLWTSTGPLSRAYVGPLFLPGRGPCFGCLVAAFDRVSPVPAIRRAIREHAASGGQLERTVLGPEITAVIVQIVRFKLALRSLSEVPAAVYRLHAIEAGSLEVATHAVPVDVECEEACSLRAFHAPM